MGDRTAIVVEIGGALPESRLEELLDAILAEGLDVDWLTSERLTVDDLRAHVEGREPLRLMANETYAEIPELAAFCAKRGLSWRMCWDAYPGSFEAGGEVHDADGDDEYTTNGTDGAVYLSAKELRELGSWDAIKARLDRLERPLPAFTIKPTRKRKAA